MECQRFISRFVLLAACAAALVPFGCSAEADNDPYPGGNHTTSSGGNTAAGGSGTAGTATVSSGGTGTAGTGTVSSGGTGTAGTGTAGTATAGTGTGGAASGSCVPQVGAATDLVISDLDGTMSNAINAPRVGYWFTFAGAGATITPPADPGGTVPFPPSSPDAANSTMYYAKVTGSGGNYVGLGFALNDGGGGVTCTYDVSAYTGISFYYKSSHIMRFAIGTKATTPPPKGTCSGGDAVCNNHHGKKTAAAAPSWTQMTVKWTDLVQDFGTMSAFDKTQTMQIQFQIEGIYNETTTMVDPIVGAYDLAVDEITFVTN